MSEEVNVTVKCPTLYSPCQVCKRYIGISHRLVLTTEAPKAEFKGILPLNSTPIKQHKHTHTRAEKRKFKELEGNLLRVSVGLRHEFPLAAADPVLSQIRSRRCPGWMGIVALYVWRLLCLFTANQTVKYTD